MPNRSSDAVIYFFSCGVEHAPTEMGGIHEFFDFEIIYQPEKAKVVADALSREDSYMTHLMMIEWKQLETLVEFLTELKDSKKWKKKNRGG